MVEVFVEPPMPVHEFLIVAPLAVLEINSLILTFVTMLGCGVWWISRPPPADGGWLRLFPSPSRGAKIVFALFGAYAILDLALSQIVDFNNPGFSYLRIGRCAFPLLLLMTLVQTRRSCFPLVAVSSAASAHMLIYSVVYSTLDSGSIYGPGLRQLVFIASSLVLAVSFWGHASRSQRNGIIILLVGATISAHMAAHWWFNHQPAKFGIPF